MQYAMSKTYRFRRWGTTTFGMIVRLINMRYLVILYSDLWNDPKPAIIHVRIPPCRFGYKVYGSIYVRQQTKNSAGCTWRVKQKQYHNGLIIIHSFDRPQYTNRVFAKVRFKKCACLPHKKLNCLPTRILWVCARGKENPAGDASETEKGNRDVRDYNIRTAAAAAVIYDASTRCTYSCLEPLVPDAAYLVYQAGSTCSRAR